MTVIDLRGLTCPEPIIKLRKEMSKFKPGDVVEVLTTDPGTMIDIPIWAGNSGIVVLECKREGDYIKFVLKKI